MLNLSSLQPKIFGTGVNSSLSYPKTIMPIQTRRLCHTSGGQGMALICVLVTGDLNPL
jgi:hypothetical protein